ncbi:MAG: PIG-L family deacetylase [Cellulomonas sp.]
MSSSVGPSASGQLPAWTSILVVVAHPDDESFALGAVISDLLARGTTVDVLCLTRGEASTLHGVAGDLSVLRQAELQDAADALGGAGASLRDHPDGGLAAVPVEVLVDDILVAAAAGSAEAMLVFDLDGVTGHPDHAAASRAAVAAAARLGIGVLAWVLPQHVADQLNDEFGASFTGHAAREIDVVHRVDRTRQRVAIAAHASQAVPSSVLWRRLELLGEAEHLRWLARAPRPAHASVPVTGQ